MAFFPRNFYANEAASFTPLFRLLDDFDSYARQSNKQSTSGRKSCVPAWQPKFDVRETAEAYELHGELAGVAKENVQIEFSDPQTLIVRGKVERSYSTATTPAAEQIEPAAESQPAESDDRASHQASVADEDEVEAQENGWQEVASNKDASEEVAAAPQETQKPADTAKYWLTERSIGEFARSFNFPTRVEQDTVSASFDNGILTVVVPKAKKHEARRIAIN